MRQYKKLLNQFCYVLGGKNCWMDYGRLASTNWGANLQDPIHGKLALLPCDIQQMNLPHRLHRRI